MAARKTTRKTVKRKTATKKKSVRRKTPARKPAKRKAPARKKPAAKRTVRKAAPKKKAVTRRKPAVKKKTTTKKPTKRVSKGKHQVNVYTTPTCPYCKMTKAWLRKNKITFKEINVLTNPDKRDYIIAKSGEIGVPQIEIDGKKVIVGYDEARLAKALL